MGGGSLCGAVHQHSCFDAALTGSQRRTYKAWVTGRTMSPVTKLLLAICSKCKRHSHTYTVCLPTKVDGKMLLSMDVVLKFLPAVFRRTDMRGL